MRTLRQAVATTPGDIRAKTWPAHLEGLGPRTIGVVAPCQRCVAAGERDVRWRAGKDLEHEIIHARQPEMTWARYGDTPLCARHAGAEQATIVRVIEDALLPEASAG